jgi:uncharacterized protein
MQILAVSDQVNDFIYSPQARVHFGDVRVVISCGDLPYYYVEYIVSTLNKPTFYVRGNHAVREEINERGVTINPGGAADLHRRVMRQAGLLLGGVEGCLRYRPGPYLYSQAEMWRHVLGLLPGLLFNRLRYGRYLDVLVTHAPPWGIHDADDLPHRGIKAFLWLDRVFQPAYHLHGHTHLSHQVKSQEFQLGRTKIVNVFGYRVIDLPAQ